MAHEGQGIIVMPSKDLPEDIKFFTNFGFQKDQIYPANNPIVCQLLGYGLTLQIDKRADVPPPTIHIITESPVKLAEKLLSGDTAPNGTTVKILPRSTGLNVPKPIQKFEITHFGKNYSWVVGRAGMLYRDLVPSELGGALIASHIQIPNDGTVFDMVHYHTVLFQLIYCYKGWVRVAYESQGEPLVLYPGDCVLQPPEIRHQVLESGDGLQAIEIGVPAQHITVFDHHTQLPTVCMPEREFHSQVFCHHQAMNAIWEFKNGFKICDTGIHKATKGVASVEIVKATDLCKPVHSSHDGDVFFTFVIKGKTELNVKDHGSHVLRAGDAFVIPANTEFVFDNYSQDLELLQVSIPKV